MADLIILKFDEIHGAQTALSAVQALEEMRYAWVDDIAVVEKHGHGRVSVRTGHGSAGDGAIWGALGGMFVFWWFPPAWFLLAAVGGAGVGAAIGDVMNRAGLQDDLKERATGLLTNNTSALLLIGATGDADHMARAFEPYHPVGVIREPISDEALAELREHLTS